MTTMTTSAGFPPQSIRMPASAGPPGMNPSGQSVSPKPASGNSHSFGSGKSK